MTVTQTGTSAGTPFGRYSLIRPIGRGGMAEVWKAKIHGPQNFQRLVVVKRILPHLSSDPEFVRMFTSEAVLSARLTHPNIVQVFEFAEVEGQHYLAMEYVPGINVGDVLKSLKHVPVPLGLAAHVVREVSLALAYAHAMTDDDGRPLSIIHRDVSPANVMLAYDGSVKLVDFGVAKALSQSDELTRTGALKGKVSYMSPEAIEAEAELDGRTDIFAAGVLLWELLTGKRLFKGQDDLKTIALVRACKVDPPSALRPEIPPSLDRIVLKALARDRTLRYQRAEELAADLSQIVNERSWSPAQTAAFFKEHDIQPGSEPELKAGISVPAAAAASSPETMVVTVVERRARSSTTLPAVEGRPRARSAAFGAVAAVAVMMTLLLVGRRVSPPPPVAATASPGPARPPPPAPAEIAVPVVPPPAAEVLAPDAGAIASARPAKIASRRRKSRAPAPASPDPKIAPRPQIDLKRGDVLHTF